LHLMAKSCSMSTGALLTTTHKSHPDSGPPRSTTSSWVADFDNAAHRNTACISKSATEHNFATAFMLTTCSVLTQPSGSR
jgi:hypothetical protein